MARKKTSSRLSSRVCRKIAFLLLLVGLPSFLLFRNSIVRNEELFKNEYVLAGPFNASNMSGEVTGTIGYQKIAKKESILEQLARENPNIPVDYVNHTSIKRKGHGKACGKLPSLTELKTNSLHWQILPILSGNGSTFYLFSAHHDKRRKGAAKIRVLAMYNDRLAPKDLFCQLWLQGTEKPVERPVSEVRYLWYDQWGNNDRGSLQPVLLTCPSSNRSPLAVSIVEKSCDQALNILKLHTNEPGESQPFAVCARYLDIPSKDVNRRLLEWLELLRILQVSKIFFYRLGLSNSARHLLNYYQERGFVDVSPISLPGNLPNSNVLRHLFLKKEEALREKLALLTYNDCLYRSIGKFTWIAILDFKEIIIPLGNLLTWPSLMSASLEESLKLKSGVQVSYCFRHVDFYEEKSSASRALPMLSSVRRQTVPSAPGWRTKCFFHVDQILAVSEHYPFECVDYCSKYHVDKRIGLLQNYKRGKESNATHFVEDNNLERFREKLVTSVKKVEKVLRLKSQSV